MYKVFSDVFKSMYYKIFDGYKEEGKLLGSFCGRSSLPTSLSSTGHIMAIHFVTDASGTDKGFKLAYFQGKG